MSVSYFDGWDTTIKNGGRAQMHRLPHDHGAGTSLAIFSDGSGVVIPWNSDWGIAVAANRKSRGVRMWQWNPEVTKAFIVDDAISYVAQLGLTVVLW